MSFKQVDMNLFRWDCDWADCPETITHASEVSSLNDMKSAMPEAWSGMLITSMGDGDYWAVLCPAHADNIKRNVVDRMAQTSRYAVGY